MTDTTALQALADKIEAGLDTAHHHAAAFPSESAYGHCTWHDSHKASGGSLDAAKALHEAVLRGWAWTINDSGEQTMWPPNEIADEEWCADGILSVGPENNPARAWLLAILRALIAKEGGCE